MAAGLLVHGEKNARLGVALMRLQPSKCLSKLRGRIGYGR